MQTRKRQMLLKLTGFLGFAGAAILAVPALNQTNFIQSVVAQTTPGVGQPTDPTAPGTTTPGVGQPTDPTAPGTTTPDATTPGLGTDPTVPGTTTPDATTPDTTTPGVGAPTDTDTDNNDDNGAAGSTQPAGEGVRALW